MLITPIPCLEDNYAYLIQPERGDAALVVDPSEAGPVHEALRERKRTLAGILNTHHHFDHVGGNEELVAVTGGPTVCGHASDRGRIPGQNRFLEDGEELALCGLRFRIMHIPGHTRGAVAYFVSDGGKNAVFTGDTLFAAGCGRLFEGTPAQMYESLNVKLAALPDDTLVYCGHEYTANNLRFAATVEPGNQAVREKAARVAELRRSGQPTVPSTIAEERLTNPFMRCEVAELIDSVSTRIEDASDPIQVLAALRAAKDAF
jgi:hydroxyacylglutathione hydrolase